MNTLQEYAEVFERLGLTELHAEDGDKKLTLRRDPGPTGAAFTGQSGDAAQYCGVGVEGASRNNGADAAQNESVNSSTSGTVATPGRDPVKQGDIIKAPLLGIFHTAGGGRQIAVGDRVSRGEAVCTIEAMKMMNEVTAPRDGVIAEILADEGAIVEYHQNIIVLG